LKKLYETRFSVDRDISKYEGTLPSIAPIVIPGDA